jgi:RimJ/RimL family protein N-acetyltransferase
MLRRRYRWVVLPLTTPRLTIRMLRTEDAAELVAYRNDPEVARHQDWTMPFTRSEAALLAADQRHLAGPAPGRWVQLAMESQGHVIGDLGVRLDEHAAVATVGYTVSRTHQRQGYATEAVGAVLAALFASGVLRVEAHVDPANTASIRLLRRLGFVDEGTLEGVALVRGEWVDEQTFGLLASEFSGRSA